MKKLVVIFIVVSIFTLSGCGNNTNQDNQPNQNQENVNQGMDHSDMNQGEMNHSSSGEVPKGLKEAVNPTYPVGSQAIITDAHMEGMKGATATIVGAYDTTAYAISYTPATGGPRVTDHRWVIHEELVDPGTAPLKPGTKVTVQAEHMAGMNGVTATIDSAVPTTVYMIDFTPTNGGEEVKNHKWVTESELSPK
ncbi:YdhK family protein [Brevibacillus panacihumi]|uniref:YdhK family protein n=1 Tax=Brevibacillus panacihumi TaxID=497735 RepID=UPI003D041DBC